MHCLSFPGLPSACMGLYALTQTFMAATGEQDFDISG